MDSPSQQHTLRAAATPFESSPDQLWLRIGLLAYTTHCTTKTDLTCIEYNSQIRTPLWSQAVVTTSYPQIINHPCGLCHTYIV